MIMIIFLKRACGEELGFSFVCLEEKSKVWFARRTSSSPGRSLKEAQTSGVEQSNLSTKLDFDPLEEEKQRWQVTSRYYHKKFEEYTVMLDWKPQEYKRAPIAFLTTLPFLRGEEQLDQHSCCCRRPVKNWWMQPLGLYVITNSGTRSSPAVLLFFLSSYLRDCC